MRTSHNANASGVFEVRLRAATWYISVNHSKPIVVGPSCVPLVNTTIMPVDSMACISVYNLYDNYVYIFTYPPVAQPPGWKPTLSMYLMSNCTLYDLRQCNYRSEIVYIYFNESSG